jgi:hypothetical protein
MRIPVGALRTVLGVVLVGAGLGLATKAGVDVPTPVLAAVPVAIALLALVPWLRARKAQRGAPRRPASEAASRPEPA